jgi:hypothetical protein
LEPFRRRCLTTDEIGPEVIDVHVGGVDAKVIDEYNRRARE